MTGRTLAERASERESVTPEGIPLRLEIAAAGDRAVAFLLDGLIQFAAMIVLVFAIRLVGPFAGDWAAATALLLFFLIRTFYFIWFEARGQGRTPGKKYVGIRVMDAAGGPLRTDAVVVRNLMRELEIWIPFMFLIAPEHIWPDAPGWAQLVFTAWALAFLLMPLFNKDRLRAGDMVAGTIVVSHPESVLLPDLGGREVVRREKELETPRYKFTDKQLDIYGIYELQYRYKSGDRWCGRSIRYRIRGWTLNWKGGLSCYVGS